MDVSNGVLYTDAQAPERNDSDLLKVLEIAHNGVLRHPWLEVKPVLIDFLRHALDDFAIEDIIQDIGPPKPFDLTAAGAFERLRAALDSFDGYPFTIQRFCELVLQPRKQYRKLEKLVSALEKCLLVTSTLQQTPKPPPQPSLEDLPRDVNSVRAPCAAAAPLPSTSGTPSLDALHSDADLGLVSALVHGGHMEGAAGAIAPISEGGPHGGYSGHGGPLSPIAGHNRPLHLGSYVSMGVMDMHGDGGGRTASPVLMPLAGAAAEGEGGMAHLLHGHGHGHGHS